MAKVFAFDFPFFYVIILKLLSSKCEIFPPSQKVCPRLPPPSAGARPLTVAGAQVWVAEAAVLAQAAHNDGDAGEEEHQADDNARHHQRRHQQAGLTAPVTAVWVLMAGAALVRAH